MSGQTKPVVEFRNVHFRIGDRTILNGLTLSIEPGETLVLLGRSGSGKTTALRLINGMILPTAGEIRVDGKTTVEWDRVRLRRGIGYVIQETGLFPHFTVERNAGLVLEAEGKPSVDREKRSRELLATVGLDPDQFARRYPHQLSGGQRQRVGLARALAADPEILLMDEPFGALDPLTRAEMQDMLRSLLSRLRKTVLLVTHDLDEALYLGNRIVLLSEGKKIADLTPEEFMASQQPEVETYIRAFHRGGRSAAREKRP